ncbi:MAG TPA: hypothetical protein VEP50_17045 [bacterium]|nr:hypothetical protein [bacterium]
MSPASSVTAIRAASNAIWNTPPVELRQIAAVHRPPSRDMAKRIYLNSDVYWIPQFFFIVAQRMRAKEQGWTEITRLLSDMVPTFGTRLKLWGFTQAADVLNTGGKGLSTAATLEDALAVIDELVLYLQRLQGWVDATIPWAALDAIAPLPLRKPSP